MSFRASVSVSFVTLLAACGANPAPDPANPGTTSAPTATVGGPGDAAFAIANAAPVAKSAATVDGPLGQGLKETSAWFAPGMTADGPVFTATLDEKGRAKADVTMRAGKCYTVVGFSPDGKVSDFDVRMWKVVKGSAPALVAEDADDDTTPTLGKPPVCPEADTAYLLELLADKGKGDVAVQLYSKAK